MEYYSAVKNNDIMAFAGKWIELEQNFPSGITCTEKDKHVLIHKWISDVKQRIIHSSREVRLTRKTIRGRHGSTWERELDEISWIN